MKQSREKALSQLVNQDQIKFVKKSLVTNIIQLDASLKDFIEIQGNQIYPLK